MAKIFLDANIILDLIQVRKNYDEAEQMMDFATEELMEIVTSESSLVNTAYVAKKSINKIIGFLQVCRIVHASQTVYIQALESDFLDKEDAIQYYIALHNGCNYFITRNLGDFKPFASAALPVKTAKEFYNHMKLS